MKKSLIFGAALFACAFAFQSCDKVASTDNPTTDPVTYEAKTLPFDQFIDKYAVDGVVNLPAGAEFTIEKALEFDEAIALVGDEKAPAKIIAKAGIITNQPITIKNVKFEVADDFTDALIKMNTLPTEGLNDKKAYEIGDITFDGVTVENLHAQFFWTNKQAYFIRNFTFTNGAIDIKGAAKKTIFDFNTGGFFENLTISKSTISADEKCTWQKGGFISTQGGKRPSEIASIDGLKMNVTIMNNTLNNICKGQNSCNYRENNKDYQYFVVKDNIVTDCDKEGQFIVGIGTGRIDAKLAATNWLASGNQVMFGGKNVGATENTKCGIEGACIVPETPAAE